MPTISTFYGITIRRFYNDHAPPHFHVQYGEFKAEMAIETVQVLVGRLPRHALAMTIEWATNHRAELLAAWELYRQHKQPQQIEPLE